jgi:hypothetical protein
MNILPLEIESMILQKKYEIETHIKFKNCIDQIDLMLYYVDNNVISSRIISDSKFTNYYIENDGIELWIQDFSHRTETVTVIYHLRSSIDITNHIF